MKIFFDVDYTILGLDDSLRPGTMETLQKIKDDGHEIYIWSGMGCNYFNTNRTASNSTCSCWELDLDFTSNGEYIR